MLEITNQDAEERSKNTTDDADSRKIKSKRSRYVRIACEFQLMSAEMRSMREGPFNPQLAFDVSQTSLPAKGLGTAASEAAPGEDEVLKKAHLAGKNEEPRRRLTQRRLHTDHPVAITPAADIEENPQNTSLIDDSDFLSITHKQSASDGISNPTMTTSMDVVFPCDSHELLDGLSKPTTNYCLQLFFKHYASFLPGIFPSDIAFMSYHAQSPFLFWTMACTGARRFHDVGYFQQAASKVRELVTASILQIQDPIQTIQAILILCLWPLPVDTMWKDPSHTMAGAAMQLAIQNGLHKFRHEQDFSRTQINSNDRNTRPFRVYLWIHCVIHFQRTSICDGLPFSSILDSWPGETEASLQLIDNQRLVSRYRLHRLQIRAITTITQNHDVQEAQGCNGISTLINVFDSQIQEIDPSTTDLTFQMAVKFSRLSLLVFHLFGPESDAMLAGAVCLFNVCKEILDLTARLDATQSFAWYSTHYHMRMILLAAFCVLRIMRSKLREMIPVNEAEQSLFKAINFVKSRSTQTTDLDAKYAIILKQLYSSTTAFRREDGEIDGLRLDIRSRLFMSIAFDSFWWWRAEFDGRPSPYPLPAATVTNDDGSTGPAAAMQRGNVGDELDPSMTLCGNAYDVFSPYEDLSNWHWPAALTFEDGSEYTYVQNPGKWNVQIRNKYRTSGYSHLATISPSSSMTYDLPD
ncbi:hypothetical protein B7463_g2163, partial [Scytalidium lignicola]